MGKGRTKPAVMTIDRTGEDRPSLFVGWIDALPVPAALIRPMDRGNFSLHASNSAFDRLDLSPAGVDAPFELRRAIELGARLGAAADEPLDIVALLSRKRSRLSSACCVCPFSDGARSYTLGVGLSLFPSNREPHRVFPHTSARVRWRSLFPTLDCAAELQPGNLQ